LSNGIDFSLTKLVLLFVQLVVARAVDFSLLVLLGSRLLVRGEIGNLLLCGTLLGGGFALIYFLSFDFLGSILS